MRERETVVLLHPGPGFDHGPFSVVTDVPAAAEELSSFLDELEAGGA